MKLSDLRFAFLMDSRVGALTLDDLAYLHDRAGRITPGVIYWHGLALIEIAVEECGGKMEAPR